LRFLSGRNNIAVYPFKIVAFINMKLFPYLYLKIFIIVLFRTQVIAKREFLVHPVIFFSIEYVAFPPKTNMNGIYSLHIEVGDATSISYVKIQILQIIKFWHFTKISLNLKYCIPPPNRTNAIYSCFKLQRHAWME
jgi:hypothetical protein